jgi:hypothetical protein
MSKPAALSAFQRPMLGALVALFAWLMAAPAAAAPGDMSAATFLAKADALEKKGAMALFSSDIGKLKAEAMAAGRVYRDRLRADKAAGRAPHSCPPQKGSLNSKQLLAHLRTYSPAERQRITMKVAIADLMAKTYPCR